MLTSIFLATIVFAHGKNLGDDNTELVQTSALVPNKELVREVVDAAADRIRQGADSALVAKKAAHAAADAMKQIDELDGTAGSVEVQDEISTAKAVIAQVLGQALCADWCYNEEHAAKGWHDVIAGQAAPKCSWVNCNGCEECEADTCAECTAPGACCLDGDGGCALPCTLVGNTCTGPNTNVPDCEMPASDPRGDFAPPWNDDPAAITDWDSWCAFELNEGCYACENEQGAKTLCIDECALAGCASSSLKRKQALCADWCYNDEHAAKGWHDVIAGQEAPKCSWDNCNGCEECEATCYQYNLDGRGGSNRFADWALSNGCGSDCDCDQLCQAASECGQSGRICHSTHYANDRRCYCFVKTTEILSPLGKESTGCEASSTSLRRKQDAIQISSIKASSASCDGCNSGGCDPRGPDRLISGCDSTVCTTQWGCGGSCDAGVLTVNGNGQGEWCSKGGSAASSGGQWIDIDLGSEYSVSKIELWSGASGNRFPQELQILTGGSIDDGSTGSGTGANACFDKSSIAADSGGWTAAGGPYTIGAGTTLTGCANARNKAGVNTQVDTDKCEVDVTGVTGQYIRLWFRGTAGNDNYMELRQVKVFGSAAEADYPADCDASKYFMSTPYDQTEIRGTSDLADMVSKCRSQYMDAGGFGGWSQRYSNGNGWCARFTRAPTQQEWDSAGSSNCDAYPGASGHCGAVCGTSFNSQASSCFGQSEYNNFDWANDNTCDLQPCTTYATADPYHAYCLKMACANTERDAWCAAGGNNACRNQCGQCSASQMECLASSSSSLKRKQAS